PSGYWRRTLGVSIQLGAGNRFTGYSACRDRDSGRSCVGTAAGANRLRYPDPAQALYSHRQDATLANPFGPVTKGWTQIAEATERAAANYRGGGATAFETAARCVTPELAYLVEVERFRANVGRGHDCGTGALRGAR